MYIIESTIAFAITMLVLSTFVTIVVETIHRFIHLRERGFQFMLQHFYQHVIAPQVDAMAANDRSEGTAGDHACKKFANDISLNRAPVGPVSFTKFQKGKKLQQLWNNLPMSWIWNGSKLNNLSVEDFMERFGSTHQGQQLNNMSAEIRNNILIDITQKYEAFGKEASIYFGRRAKLVSVFVALFAALYFQINAAEIFSSYLKDATLRGQVIGNADVAKQNHKLQEKRIEVIISQLKNDSQSEQKQNQELKKSIEAIKEVLDKQRTQFGIDLAAKQPKFFKYLDSLTDDPGENITTNNSAEQSSDWTISSSAGDFLMALFRGETWLFIFTGLLIGLGGPFWHDMVNSVTQLGNLFGSFTTASQTRSSDGKQITQTSTDEIVQPRTPVDVFMASANATSNKANYRPSLTRKGEIDSRGEPQ